MPSYASRGYASKIVSAQLTDTTVTSLLADDKFLVHQIGVYFGDGTKTPGQAAVTFTDHGGTTIWVTAVGDGNSDDHNCVSLLWTPFIAERGIRAAAGNATDLWVVVAYEGTG